MLWVKQVKKKIIIISGRICLKKHQKWWIWWLKLFLLTRFIFNEYKLLCSFTFLKRRKTHVIAYVGFSFIYLVKLCGTENKFSCKIKIKEIMWDGKEMNSNL